MDTNIPSSLDVRERLARLSFAQMEQLSRVSGVAFTTLWKVRNGETENPRIDTVRQFLPYVAAIATGQVKASA